MLKATPARWWGTHKQSIIDWTQCRRLMEIIFGEKISYSDKNHTGLIDHGTHIEQCRGIWKEYLQQEWAHQLIRNIEMVPRSWYTSKELQ